MGTGHLLVYVSHNYMHITISLKSCIKGAVAQTIRHFNKKYVHCFKTANYEIAHHQTDNTRVNRYFLKCDLNVPIQQKTSTSSQIEFHM